MMNFQNLLVWIFFLILCCCKGKKDGIEAIIQPSDTIHFQVSMDKSISFEEEIDSVFLIQLESQEDALFGGIDKLLVSDDLIYVLDNKYSKAVFVFNFDGKLIYKLFKVGDGPGEYLDIFDFDVIEEGLYLSDMGRKIIKYNKTNGTYMNEYEFHPWGGMEFILSNEEPKRILFNRNFGHDDVIEGKVGRCLISSSNLFNNMHICLFDYSEEFAGEIYVPNQVFTRHKGNIWLSPHYSFQLYKYNSGSLKPMIYLDFGGSAFDLNRLKSNYNDQRTSFDYLNTNNFIHHILLWCSTSNIMFMSYKINNTNYSFFINLQENNIITEGSRISSQLKYGFTIHLPLETYKDWFITVLNADSAVEIIDQDTSEILLRTFESNNIDSISPNDNPLLVFYHLR